MKLSERIISDYHMLDISFSQYVLEKTHPLDPGGKKFAGRKRPHGLGYERWCAYSQYR